MPRYDDRHGTARLYVGHLSSRTRSRDLEDVFSRYGRIRDVDMKRDFAFVEFSDPRDADDARYSLNGRDVDGSRIVVEFAKGEPRGSGSGGGFRGGRGADSGGSREYLGRGPPPGSGRCFNCGLDGHWARDCKAGDWKNKCYRCGDRGHIERNCQNSPKKVARGRSYSRSPSPPRRSRSYSRSRSNSRSPPPKRGHSNDRKDRKSRSPKRNRASSPPPKVRARSPSPDERSPQDKGAVSPIDNDRFSNGSDYSGGPSKGRKRTPVEDDGDAIGREKSPEDRSPVEENGRSPVDDDDEENPGGSTRGSDSE